MKRAECREAAAWRDLGWMHGRHSILALVSVCLAAGLPVLLVLLMHGEAYGLPAYVGHACVAGADAQQYGEGALTPCPAGMLPIQDPVPVAELAYVAFLACALVMLSPLMP